MRGQSLPSGRACDKVAVSSVQGHPVFPGGGGGSSASVGHFIVTVGRSHRAAVLSTFPSQRQKILTRPHALTRCCHTAGASPKHLTCSLSRVQTQLFVSAVAEGAGSEERTAGDRTRRRRLNKLSCADWLPHDRGFVSELPGSKDERRSGDRLITGQEGSPPRPCRRQCAPVDRPLSTSSRCGRPIGSDLERRLGDAGDSPDKADHLTGDCRGDHDLWLARRSQPPIARAQPYLPFPSDVADPGDSF